MQHNDDAGRPGRRVFFHRTRDGTLGTGKNQEGALHLRPNFGH